VNKWLFIVLIFFSCSKNQNYNVVWIVVEDQSQYFFPTYGNDEISLPNLESLANESLVFENMYATYPVCAPARSSIITGMYPSSIGTHNMRAFNGNREVRGKKNDFNPCSESESLLDIPYYSSNLAEQIPSFPEILRENNYYTTNNSKRDYNFKISENVWDESSNKADWSNRSLNQPFFSVFNFAITHESSIWRRDSDKLLVNPDDLYIPPFFPNDSLTRHSYAVNYSNLILVDRQIGNLIERLKNDNLYDSSYIFFYSDHGGPFPRHKRSLKDTGVKVPFYVKQPKNLREKTNTDQLLSFVDFAPTVLSILDLEIPSVYQGVPFLGSKKSKKSREFVFTASDHFLSHIILQHTLVL
jgi:N-sulfoglucosamine sulfohydrolase